MQSLKNFGVKSQQNKLWNKFLHLVHADDIFHKQQILHITLKRASRHKMNAPFPNLHTDTYIQLKELHHVSRAENLKYTF